MAKEQDVFQLPVRFIDHQDIEGMALAVQRNFKELERQLALLQLAVKKATGGGIKDLPDKASIWDRADAINEDGTIPAQMLNDKLVGLEHELQLADEAVTEAKIAVGAITNKKLAIDAVTAEKIAEAAVTAQKLAQEAVTEEKIAGEAITAEKIKAGAIGTVALAAGAVTTDKLDAQAVTAGKIAARAVTAEKIQAGSITSQHINADGITANLITSGELLTAKVTVASQDGYTKFRGDGITVQDRTGATRIALGRVDELGQQTATFTRNSEAYTSDGQKVAVNQPRFEPGKFGQAVLVEEGTTNLFTNPKLLNNGQDWTPNSSTAWVDSSGEYPYIHCEAQWDGVYQTLSLSATTYTLTYLVKHKSGSNQIGSHFDGSPTVKIRVDGGEWIDGSTITVPSDGNWHLVEIQATYTTAGSYGVYLQPGRGVVGVNEFWFKYAQLEQKPYPTTFIDGTRSPETLTILTEGVLNPQEGTVELVIIPQNNYSGTAQVHFEANAGTTNKSQVFIFNEDGYWRCGLFDKNWTVRKIDVPYDGQQGVPTRIALTWKNCNSGSADAEVKLYKNGILQGIVSGVQIDMESAFTVCSIGRRALSTAFWGNALYDDLRISSIARSDEEIKQAYENNQPLVWDEHTTYLMRFDGNLQPVIGHEHSLKMSHGSGEYTKVSDRGLERFVPKPIYTKVPTGIPNKENFETGFIPTGWEVKNAIISSVSYEGNYSLRLNPGIQDIKSYARTVQEITGTTTMSFWYRCTSVAYGDVYEFNLDGHRYELTDDNTWRYFSATVEEGLHVFEWAINRWSDSIPTSSYMYIDDIVFEMYPASKEITGYSEEGYSYGYRTYVGVASTFGLYLSSSFGFFPDDEDIPDIWIQLPEDFKGKEFEVFLSFSDNSNQEWLTISKIELTLLEIDKANGRFKVRAHAQGSDRTYRLVSGSLEETRSYSISGIKFTYLATY
ncbi:MAG: phage head spike fiber domain-containing protein [Coriobacteriales bacterium]|jgi:hypothetical protein